MKSIYPTSEEVKDYLLSTIKHVFNVEYYLYKIGAGDQDVQRPHDIVGPGNKFSWDVLSAFSIYGRLPGNIRFNQKYILPAREIHRQQHHHQRWNNPNPDATFDDMCEGAIDTVCACLENRPYNGGPCGYDGIIKKISEPHKIPWIEAIIPMMKKIPAPALDRIDNIKDFPNIDVQEDIYQKIIIRLFETEKMLLQRGYVLD